MTTIIHPLDDNAVCSGELLWGAAEPWKDCVQPEHGTVVTCPQCGKLGIVPDEGRESEFLP